MPEPTLSRTSIGSFGTTVTPHQIACRTKKLLDLPVRTHTMDQHLGACVATPIGVAERWNLPGFAGVRTPICDVQGRPERLNFCRAAGVNLNSSSTLDLAESVSSTKPALVEFAIDSGSHFDSIPGQSEKAAP
jgi:hypothetical protein